MSALMFVLALEVDIHIAQSRSLKAKRQVVRSIVDASRRRFGVAAAEVDHLDMWQRAGLGFAAVSGQSRHAEEVIDEVERFVWSHPDVQVLSAARRWMDA